MGATCSKCCLCYCLKLFEFGESFRCQHPCCVQYCEPCCHCGDCCDVEDIFPFVEETEASREEDAVVYPNGDKYIGAMHNNKKHGYGELIRKNGTSLKGYFVEDQYVGEMPPDSLNAPASASSVEDQSNVAIVKQAEPTVSYRKFSPSAAADDEEELLQDT